MRKAIIAGNWKMNKTVKEAKELIKELKPLVKKAKADVVVCVPFVNLPAVVEACKGSNIKVGAQNVHWAESGAFTGEISADMLLAIGVEYVIIGHSERRQYFGETDETVNKRTLTALAKNLKPIVCIGETLEERENSKVKEVLERQTKKALENVKAADIKNLVIAYEPVWAIGTGKTATAEEANASIKLIRDTVKALYNKKVAEEDLRIQYGGSMNPTNVKGLMSEKEIDGGLIGGASLKAEKFAQVVNY